MSLHPPEHLDALAFTTMAQAIDATAKATELAAALSDGRAGVLISAADGDDQELAAEVLQVALDAAGVALTPVVVDLGVAADGAPGIPREAAAGYFEAALDAETERIEAILTALGFSGPRLAPEHAGLAIALCISAEDILGADGLNTAIATAGEEGSLEDRLMAVLDALLSKSGVMLQVESGDRLRPPWDGFLMRATVRARGADHPLLVALLVSPDGLAAGAAARAMGNLATTITVSPLNDAAIGDVMNATLGTWPTEVMTQQVAAISGRGPVRVVELAQWISDDPALSNAAMNAKKLAPTMVEGYLTEGWEAKTPEGRSPQSWLADVLRFLGTGGLAGDTFPWNLVSAVYQVPTEADEEIADFVDAVFEGEEGLVEDLGARGHRFDGLIAYHFPEPLLRRALEAALFDDATVRTLKGKMAQAVLPSAPHAVPAVSRLVGRLLRELGEEELGCAWIEHADLQLATEHYQAWANGLMDAPEATDGAHAAALVRLVEGQSFAWPADRRVLAARLAAKLAERAGETTLLSQARSLESSALVDLAAPEPARIAAEVAVAHAGDDVAAKALAALSLGEALLLGGGFEPAKKLLADAMAAMPEGAETDSELALTRARTLAVQGRLSVAGRDVSAATAALEGALKAYDTRLDAVANRADGAWSVSSPNPGAVARARNAVGWGALAKKDLAIAHWMGGEPQKAFDLLEEARIAFSGVATPGHIANYGILLFSARAVAQLKRTDEAIERYRGALDLAPRLPPPFSPFIAEPQMELASMLLDKEEPVEAEALLREASARLEQSPRKDPARMVNLEAELARARGMQGFADEAIERLTAALKRAHAELGPDAPQTKRLDGFVTTMRIRVTEAKATDEAAKAE